MLTRERGVVAVTVAVGKSAASRRRNALLMPGSRVEVVIRPTVGQSVATLIDVGVAGMATPFLNPASTATALFICEVVATLLREASPDTLLFDFVDHSIALLGSPRPAPNLPIAFLIRLMDFMGISPDERHYRRGMFLDLSGGIFREDPPLTGHWLDRDESLAAARLLRINYRNMRLYHLNRDLRAQILNRLLDYYTLHFTPMTNLRTLPILHTIFS